MRTLACKDVTGYNCPYVGTATSDRALKDDFDDHLKKIHGSQLRGLTDKIEDALEERASHEIHSR